MMTARVARHKEVATLRVEPSGHPSDGFFLLHYDASGACVADTWHATLHEAQRQAKSAFGVAEEDWSAEPK